MSAVIGDRMEHFVSGAAIAVDPGAIEKELAGLWRQSAKGEEAVARACLWNLVVWAHGDLKRAKDLVDAIAPACPARALLMHAAADGGAELEAFIEANCRFGHDGGRVLCSEEITLVARGGGESLLPALVRSLAVPDVPSAIVWVGPPPTRDDIERVARLGAGAQRLIVDSGDQQSTGDLSGLAELCWIAQALELADLGWLRQASFRGLLAGIFDRPVGAEPLRRLARVRLDSARHGAATAKLLLGWLATRLGWEPFEPKAEGRWTTGKLEVEIAVRDIEAGRDGIYQIVLETDRGERFSITDSGPEWLEIAAAGLPTRTVAAPDAVRSDAELMVAALGAHGHDPLYAQALARASELL